MISRAVSFIKKLFNKKERQEEPIADFHTTIIRVDDNFISASSIMLDEKLIGNIYSLKEVIVAPTAEVSGNITSRICTIDGKVYGDILSTEYAQIKSTAVITGCVRAKSISIEPGSVINGSIRIEGEIDERDLIEKVENRLPSKTQKDTQVISYVLSEVPEPENELILRIGTPAARPSEINKRPSVPSLKPKVAKPADREESDKNSANGWY